MINLELELQKCRERTKDESVILLMMQAKVDMLREMSMYREAHEEIFWWVNRQAIHAWERSQQQQPVGV